MLKATKKGGGEFIWHFQPNLLTNTMWMRWLWLVRIVNTVLGLRNWRGNTGLRPSAVGPYCPSNFSDLWLYLLIRTPQSQRILSLPEKLGATDPNRHYQNLLLLIKKIISLYVYLFVKASLIQNGVRIRIAEWDWKRHGHNCDRMFMKVEWCNLQNK